MDIRFISSYFLKIILLIKLIHRMHCVNPFENYNPSHSQAKRDTGFLLIGNNIIFNSTESISKLLEKTKYSNPPPTVKHHESTSTGLFHLPSEKTTPRSKVMTKIKEISRKTNSNSESTMDVTSPSSEFQSRFQSLQPNFRTDKNIEFNTTLKTSTDIPDSTITLYNESSTKMIYSTDETSPSSPEPLLETTSDSENSSETNIMASSPTTLSKNEYNSESNAFPSHFTSAYSAENTENFPTSTTHFVEEQTSERIRETSVSEQRHSAGITDVSKRRDADKSTQSNLDIINLTTEKYPETSESFETTESTTTYYQSTGTISSVADFEQSSGNTQSTLNSITERPQKLQKLKEASVSKITNGQMTHGFDSLHQTTNSKPDVSGSDIIKFQTTKNPSGKIPNISVSISKVSTFASVTNASTNNSFYISNIQLKTKKDGDDTYWPIAMAITIAVPTIIVVGITITVIHKKRKLERAHSLTGYITPPMEYDV